LTYKPRYFIEYDGKIYYKRKKEDQKAREYFPINKIIAIQITKGNFFFYFYFSSGLKYAKVSPSPENF